MRQLGTNSDTVLDINDTFSRVSKTLKIISFFETTNTRYKKVSHMHCSKLISKLGWIPTAIMIVPKESATLGFPDEARYPLNGDHLSIVKFDSKTDQNYQKIATELYKLVQDMSVKPLEESKP